MARQTDYPRASLKIAIQLADAVYDLGGTCSIEMAADKLDKKMGGAFTAQYSSAAKYGMVTSAKGQLKTTNAYRNYKLAYNSEEERKCLVDFILSPPAFSEIYHRFKNIELPLSHFDRLLIREFDVPEQDGSKISKYFIEGVKLAGLLTPDNKLKDIGIGGGPTNELDESEDFAESEPESESEKQTDQSPAIPKGTNSAPTLITTSHSDGDSSGYSVHIQGPGMNSVIKIVEQDDIAIVELMLTKIKKKLE
ncbi:hypothetical protein [Rheinheimera sp.]|uniref:hypothetical protein n=1 Tax=Rheinheimera sp. TaxID=1869214 RepID=UPI003AF9AE87